MDRMHDVFEAVARQFGVLGEPARLRILHVLGDREHCVSDILRHTGLAQANASRHLGVLYRAGVVGRRREGTQVLYRVADPLYVELCRAMTSHGPARDGVLHAVRDGMQRLLDGQVFPRPAQPAGASPTPPANEKEEASV